MKKFFGYLILLIACLIVGAGAFLFVVAPTDIIRDQVIAAVKRETGRDLVVRGGTSLSVFPSLGIKLANVELSMPPKMQFGGTREAFVRMEALHLSMPIGPLLRQEVQVDEFRLERPVINLVIDNRGRQSWDFARAKIPATRIVRRAQYSAQAIKQVRLGDIRINNGELIFQNQKSGAREQLSNINLVAALETLAAPLSLKADATWRGRPFELDAQLRAPEDILNGKAAKLSGQLISQSEKIELNGNLSAGNGKPFRYNGRAVINAPNASSIADVMSVALPPRKAFQSLSINGVLDVRPSRVGFSKTEFQLGRTRLAGDLVLDLDGAKPFIQGTLATDALNLDEFLFDAAVPSSKPALRPSKAEFGIPGIRHASYATGDARLIQVQSIPRPAPPSGNPNELRLDRPGRPANDNRAATPSEWGTEPLDLAILRSFDAAISLNAQAVYYKKMQTSVARAKLKLSNAQLGVTLQQADLYNGKAAGKIDILAIGSRPSFTGKFKLIGLEALPFLKALNGFDWIAGTANADIEFNAAGEHQRALVGNLDGRGIFKVTDGAIVGVNIPQMMRGIKQGDFSGFQRQETKSTDFSALDGSFTILGGIVQTNDTRLSSPLLRVKTAGQVHIPRRLLDLQVNPRVVTSLSGQQAKNDGVGFNIPFKVQGPWAKPNIVPDLNGILKNPGGVIDTAKDLGRKFKNGKIKGKDIENVLKGLFGGR